MAVTLSTLNQHDRGSPERGPISGARIREDLGVSRERMARLFDVSARTIQRWVMQVLIDVQNIVDLGLRVFEPRGVHLIMTPPQPGFGDKSGLEFVEAGRSDTVFGSFAGGYDGLGFYPMLERALMPGTGAAYHHISARATHDVLGFSFVGLNADNRRNTALEPSHYVAGDQGVVIAEWGRNFRRRRSESVREPSVERSVFRLSLRLDAVLDLHDPHVAAMVGAADAPGCFTGRAIAHFTAALIRVTTSANAILVPSIAFLDDLTRWNFVVFLDTMPDALPTGASSRITRTKYAGPLRWR